MRWTARDIPDLKGRTSVVTGANGGLGYVTARELARRGARVVLACRSQRRGQSALTRLLEEVPEARAELRLLDLGDLASVRAFAGDWGEAPLHLLVNNAGLMAVPRSTTADGFESQFGVNHLGHFALTGLLCGALRNAGGARVVTVSSLLHLVGNVNINDLNAERRYRRWLAYGRSKTANLLFTHELARRAAGTDLLAAAVHPGYADTGLQLQAARLERNAVKERVARLGNRLLAARPEAGAMPTLYAATAPGVAPDSFTGPGALRGRPGRTPRAPWTLDDAVARRLWQVSEELTGIRYPLPGAG
ncbi:oxidoreductase [Streptomyces triticirhizae]|uniref:SDR family NAD(P)-dependent oxidoreductase n=1 Tax=Streptomyces triticirhizae TaxID=2483353 RepID=A0A3M2LWF2_9ACTN|nr:oxidoreductase [Streptomyces triticirhizae]RMI41542.1 SDR family NAD(P)-dependent oxidoreductase [Streptomyces triticirhizae]